MNVPADRPEWLKKCVPASFLASRIPQMINDLGIHTVCSSAVCPNMGECYGRGTATFMILGGTCTRGCRFCAVPKGVPDPLDPAEPAKVAAAVKTLGLKHAVITSVTRDDLPDGGAGQFAAVIGEIRDKCPQTRVEVLVPDFRGDTAALATVLRAVPDVFNHNIETVPGLYGAVRPQADYRRSLQTLEYAAKRGGTRVKSGLMLGLGESERELLAVLGDLRSVGVEILTMGQYLAPSAQHYPVKQYVRPEQFDLYRQAALSLGFHHVAAGPFVRSSYWAEKQLEQP
ncbi:MAG TPA: lipoyl synthase [Negativicutes bacterium]|nr:lipoyl synthase [Negativicutes bacterium]